MARRVTLDVKGYIQALGLRWRVDYRRSLETAYYGISSSRADKLHLILVGGAFQIGSIISDESAFLPGVVRQLCRAALAERIDPAFATKVVATRRGQIVSPEKLAQADAAWWQTDVWAGDIMAQHWPDLLKLEMEYIESATNALVVKGKKPLPVSPNGIIVPVLGAAQTARHGLPSINCQAAIAELAKRYTWPGGCDLQLTLAELTRFYRDLPRLSGERRGDLELLQRSISEAVRIFGLSIRPELIEVGGIVAWLI